MPVWPQGLVYTGCLRRSGETGRRAGLKIPFPSGSVGSTPTSGTIQSARQDGHSPRSGVAPEWGGSMGADGACATNVRAERVICPPKAPPQPVWVSIRQQPAGVRAEGGTPGGGASQQDRELASERRPSPVEVGFNLQPLTDRIVGSALECLLLTRQVCADKR